MRQLIRLNTVLGSEYPAYGSCQSRAQSPRGSDRYDDQQKSSNHLTGICSVLAFCRRGTAGATSELARRGTWTVFAVCRRPVWRRQPLRPGNERTRRQKSGEARCLLHAGERQEPPTRRSLEVHDRLHEKISRHGDRGWPDGTQQPSGRPEPVTLHRCCSERTARKRRASRRAYTWSAIRLRRTPAGGAPDLPLWRNALRFSALRRCGGRGCVRGGGMRCAFPPCVTVGLGRMRCVFPPYGGDRRWMVAAGGFEPPTKGL